MSESFNFKQWLFSQKGPYTLSAVDENHVHVDTEYGLGEVNFYHLDNEPEIVELRVTCRKTNLTKFFLHFQPVQEAHSKDLFNEMVSALLALKYVQTTKVLLCCTAGMTTSFFAEKLNEAARMADMDCVFSAVSVQEVYASAKDYDVILVAPQVAYEQKRLQRSLSDKPVLNIPTALFAKYDAVGCLEYVRKEVEAYFQKKKENKSQCCTCCKKHTGKMLVIAVAPSHTEVQIRYRIYENGKITLDRKALKKTLSLQDLDDIVDVQICQNTGAPFTALSIAVPGVIRDGKLDLPKTNSINLQGNTENMLYIQKHFETCVQIPVIIENNANCAAYGWYSNQEKYHNICLMSQPSGWLVGGQGIIVNGKLVRGAHGLAGEIKHILNQFQYERPLAINPYSIDSIKEIIGKAILTNLVILDPEVIVIRNDMIVDTEEIREELKKYLPEENIPEIVRMEDFNEYVLAGQESLLADYVKQDKK